MITPKQESDVGPLGSRSDRIGDAAISRRRYRGDEIHASASAVAPAEHLECIDLRYQMFERANDGRLAKQPSDDATLVVS